MQWIRQAMGSIGAAMAALVVAAPLASAVTITRIAAQGEVAPHPAAPDFFAFLPTHVSRDGSVLFQATHTASVPEAPYAFDGSGAPYRVAGPGPYAGAPAGATTTGGTTALRNEAFALAVSQTLVGGPFAGATAAVFGSDAAGDTDLRMHGGAQAPGLASGVLLRGVAPASIDERGAIVIATTLVLDASRGIDFNHDAAIYRSTAPGSIDLIFHEGADVPGWSGLAVSPTVVATNDTGGVALRVRTPTSGISGFLAPDGAGGLGVAAREGDAIAPGLVLNAISGTPELNDAGRLAFFGDLGGAGATENSDGAILARDAGGALEIVVREGAQAPGAPAGALFGNIASAFDMNAHGQLALHSTLVTTGGVATPPISGIFGPDDAGDLTLRVARGDAVPGFVGVSFQGFDDPLLNDAGDLAFRAVTSDLGGDGLADDALVHLAQGGVAVVLLHEQQLLEYAPGDLRHVRSILTAVFDDALAHAAVRVTFAEGGEGLYLLTIPEPGTAVLLGLGVGALRRHRSRARPAAI